MPFLLLALNIYEDEVDPVFALCGITTEVIVTKSHGEGRSFVLTNDLRGIDGIVAVGGDGTFSDIAKGLLERTQRDAGIDIRNSENTTGGDEVSLIFVTNLFTSDYLITSGPCSRSSPKPRFREKSRFLKKRKLLIICCKSSNFFKPYQRYLFKKNISFLRTPNF